MAPHRPPASAPSTPSAPGDNGAGTAGRERHARSARAALPLALVAAVVAVLTTACTVGGPVVPPTDPGPTTTAPGTTPGTGPAPCADATAPTTVAYRTVAGFDPDLTSLDVHTRPAACGAPVVVWVHGGGYVTGDKANGMGDKVALAEREGWVLVSVNYRLTTPASPDAADSARWPDHFDDVAAAVAWVHDHIATYGGDPSRIALLGHSAGADIVANVATNPRYLTDAGLGLDALRCAGPLDTEGFDKVTSGAGDPGGESTQWLAPLGNAPDHLTSTSATRLVRPGIDIPPMIGVVRGSATRQAIEHTFLETLRANGIAATEIDARSLSHEEVNRRIGAPGDTVMTPPLATFLDDCFAS